MKTYTITHYVQNGKAGIKQITVICKIHKGQIFRPTPASHYL